jgi:hypothetical protein
MTDWRRHNWQMTWRRSTLDSCARRQLAGSSRRIVSSGYSAGLPRDYIVSMLSLTQIDYSHRRVGEIHDA